MYFKIKSLNEDCIASQVKAIMCSHIVLKEYYKDILKSRLLLIM